MSCALISTYTNSNITNNIYNNKSLEDIIRKKKNKKKIATINNNDSWVVNSYNNININNNNNNCVKNNLDNLDSMEETTVIQPTHVTLQGKKLFTYF